MVTADPFSKLAHEVWHANEQTHGSQSLNMAERESSAVRFENVFRREAAKSGFVAGQQMGQRDCWKDPCSTPGPRKASGAP